MVGYFQRHYSHRQYIAIRSQAYSKLQLATVTDDL
jgi:hypothetical protein